MNSASSEKKRKTCVGSHQSRAVADNWNLIFSAVNASTDESESHIWSCMYATCVSVCRQVRCGGLPWNLPILEPAKDIIYHKVRCWATSLPHSLVFRSYLYLHILPLVTIVFWHSSIFLPQTIYSTAYHLYEGHSISIMRKNFYGACF